MGANKYSIFPIKNTEIWEMFKKHQNAFWTSEELDFAQDVIDINTKLNKNEIHFITHVLAFFAQADGVVNENLAIRFYKDIDMPEARAFYSMQILMETIHAEVYGLLIDTYVANEKEKDRLFNAIENIPTVAKKAKWAIKWIDSQESFAKRLIAFALVEGVFFSGSFCSIFWFRNRGLLKGLGAANDFISRDEGLHWQFAALLYKKLNLSISKEEFIEILNEAVEIEKEFVTDALPVSMIGMNQNLMCDYIEYVADRVSSAFGFDNVYNAKNPFDFMKLMDVEVKSNFFEERVTNYQRSPVREISFDGEF